MAEQDGERTAALAPGEEFAGHRIEAVIGRGGMGVVYRARNLALDRDRALKVIAPELGRDSRFRARFEREARLAASLEHPNVVAVHDAGERDGRLFLAMSLVEGADLRALVETGGPLEPARAARIVAAVAAALDAAHERGLVHRDVKPANVLVEGKGERERVFLTDFGISRATAGGETVTASGEIVGSAGFIAPEQIAGDPLDGRADVYALGALAHFALTGEPPFPRESELATLFAHAKAPRPRPSTLRSELPQAVDAAIARAMAVEPAQRPANAGAFARELAASLGDPTPTAVTRPLRPKPTPTPSGSRRRLLLALGTTALAAVAALVAVLVITGEQEASDTAKTQRRTTTTAPEPLAKPVTIPVGRAPTGLTVGERQIWVAVRDEGDVVGINPATDEPSGTMAAVPSPSSVSVGEGSIWAVSDVADALFRLDPAQGTAPQEIPLGEGSDPSDVVVDSYGVWVTLEGINEVARYDPASGALVTEEVGDAPRAIASGEGSIWVANVEADTVSRIDPLAVERLDDTIDVSGGGVRGRPSDIAVGGGSVWTIDNLNGTVTRIDPGPTGGEAKTVGEPFGPLSKPRGIKYGFGSLWVANAGRDELLRLDPADGLVLGAVPVGDDPADVAIGEGSVWTANDAGGSVSRVDPGQPSP